MKTDVQKILQIFKLVNKSQYIKTQLPYSIAKLKKLVMYMNTEMLDQFYAALLVEEKSNK